MQPTALNKVVSLFLAGGLVILGLVYLILRHGDKDTLAIVSDSLSGVGGEGFVTVVGGLLLLPLAALAGAVSEGLTDIIIRWLVKSLVERPFALKILFQSRDDYNFWKLRFKEAAGKSSYLAEFPVKENPHGTAVALLYGSAQEESINWAESHYSTYILASNFALLALTALPYLFLSWFTGWIGRPAVSWAALVTIVVFYTCLCLSMDRYLYSYLAAMRQATIVLLKENAARPAAPPQTTEKTPSPDPAA